MTNAIRTLGLLILSWPVSIYAMDDPEWAFKPVKRPAVPSMTADSPIDALLLAKLKSKALTFVAPADKTVLIRRITMDLTGLPPTPEEIQTFVGDRSSDAYSKLVDRLLASSAFGERQATWWLDVVRYAESDGFKADDPRPNAWRYRDYVIQSFNSDKPFDRMITEQLAGDERFPGDGDALVATGFLRHYPDEYNAVNLEQRRQEILFDITDTTASAFLGITLGCAKCHDHKFDPIAQSDYFRIQAFFAGYFPKDSSLLSGESKAAYEAKRKAWDEKTAAYRAKLEEIEKPYLDKEMQRQRERHVEYVHLMDKPAHLRTPLETQIAAMVAVQVNDVKVTAGKMKPADKQTWEGMKKKIAEHDSIKPPTPPMAMAMGEVGQIPPPTHLLKRGNWRFAREEIKPGYLSAFDDRDEENITPTATTSGRRSKLAAWIASERNPLTARVLVNRVWQQLFGRGIVATPADFGVAGERPSHPELLDWLASEFMAQKWSIKSLYRMIVMSQGYRQSSIPSDDALKHDPDNRLFSRMNRKRLDGETLRDAILAVSGLLNRKSGGPAVFPELPAEVKAGNWKPNSDVSERNRRSVYVAVRRNLRYPLFALFDAPDRNETCSFRYPTTTAPQALALLNDEWIIKQAKAFANRVKTMAGDDDAKRIEAAFRLAYGRPPESEEREAVAKFAANPNSGDPLTGVCHALMNANPFLYID
jgi:hypothetical protein